MPNFLQLRKKGQEEPSDFISIDEEICRHLEITPDEKYYAYQWYDIIGYSIAAGSELGSEDLRERIKPFSEELNKILAFLEEHYESSSWSRIGNPR